MAVGEPAVNLPGCTVLQIFRSFQVSTPPSFQSPRHGLAFVLPLPNFGVEVWKWWGGYEKP